MLPCYQFIGLSAFLTYGITSIGDILSLVYMSIEREF